MEKKNNFKQLILYSLKEKRSWVLLSTVIIFVTTLLIPYILKIEKEIFILFGIFELFILVFINCLIDNSFLHDESKLSYYRSKPITLKGQLTINIITNVVFTVYLIFLIILSLIFHNLDFEILEVFKMLVPWLAAGILLASLSSVLSGNTLMAGAMTIFNFCLPLIVFLVIIFMFSILENFVIGFSSDVLTDYLLDSIYRLDYLYFTRYFINSIDLIYFVLLAIIIGFISFLLNWTIGRRKNERTGFIVFDGYKYFVSVLACLIIPAFFSLTFPRYSSTVSIIIISFSLALLTYYIIIAFIEKSFRISKLSIKVFAISMVLFSAVMGATILVANHYKDVIPKSEDVKIAYVGNQTWNVRNLTKFLEENPQPTSLEEWKRIRGMVTYKDKENIESIIGLHKEILEDQGYNTETYYSRDFIVVYWMKDGKSLIRHYNLKNIEGDSKNSYVKDALANNILNSNEYIRQKYYYFYDEEYYGGRNLYAILRKANRYDESSEGVALDDLRESFQQDMENTSYERSMPFAQLSNSYYEDDYIKSGGYYLEIYEKFSDAEEIYLDEIFIREDFIRTLEFFGE